MTQPPWRPKGTHFAYTDHEHPHHHRPDPLTSALLLGLIITDLVVAAILVLMIVQR